MQMSIPIMEFDQNSKFFKCKIRTDVILNIVFGYILAHY